MLSFVADEDEKFDLYLMNAVCLSELWAFQDLSNFKKAYPNLWGRQLEDQLADEFRHYRMCFGALKDEAFEPQTDLSFSMQEKLYAPFFNLRPVESLQDLASLHSVFERRAVWVFKTYQKVGRNEKFKKIFKAILKDEADHNHQLRALGPEQVNNALRLVDQNIWRKLLPAKFGPKIFSSVDLWRWYYSPSLSPSLIDVAINQKIEIEI